MTDLKPRPYRNRIPDKKFKIRKLEVGSTFYKFDGYKHHIVGFCKDGPTTIVTYKYWLKYKGYWGYNAEELYLLLNEQKHIYKLSEEEYQKLCSLNEVDVI